MTHAATVAGLVGIGRSMLMISVIVPGNIAILRSLIRLMVCRSRVCALIAKRHRNRVQVLHRQAGNQHHQSKSFQETFHATILII